MTARKNENVRGRLAATAALTGVCCALGIAPAHAEITFEPRLGVDVTWSDNVELAAPGAPKRDELIGQLMPGFLLAYDSQNLQAYADYELQAVYFQDSSDSNEVFHRGELGVQVAAIQDWLFVDLAAARAQTVIDPAGPTNLNNMFRVGNTADATSAQITPILRHAFRAAQFEASYTRGLVNYSNARNRPSGTPQPGNLTTDDSKNEQASFDLSSVDQEALVTWDVNYLHEKVDYSLAATFQYDQAQAELGFAVTPALRLLARGGRESDPRRDLSRGGLDETSWEGGFSWRPSAMTELRLLAGKRFFGTTYDGLWRYTGRLLEAEVNYHESPTTQTQSYALRAVTAPGDFPVGIDPGFSRTTSDVFLLRQLEGRIGLRGRVTEIFLSVDSERREYFTALGGEDKYHGVTLLVGRQVGPRVRVEATAELVGAKLLAGEEYNERRYALTLARQIGLRTNVTLSGNRVDRSGGTNPYAANWVVLGVRMVFAGNRSKVGGIGRNAPVRRSRSTLPTVPGQR
jgi:hypothetical protein